MLEIIDIKKNPVSFFVFLIASIVFSIARIAGPQSVRFLIFEYQELPQRWYAILTYGFVHVEWNHFIVNMLLLLYIGVWVERLIGLKRYTVLVIVGILAGGVTLLVRETAGIGFSAAVGAIIFYYCFAFPMEKELPFKLPNILVPMTILIISIGSIVFNWMPTVGHYPHIAGGLVGIIALMIFRKQHKPI